MSEALFFAAVEVYAGRFGDTPNVMGISTDDMKEATNILMEAVENNSPLSDEEFFAKLGIDPPEEGAPI